LRYGNKGGTNSAARDILSWNRTKCAFAAILRFSGCLT
jgi:hypothetical protein